MTETSNVPDFFILYGTGDFSSCGNLKVRANPSLTEYFSGLFSTDQWTARWACGEWSLFEGWMYILSDLLIFLAYLSIPIFLFYFNIKQRNSPFKGVVLLFALFIIFCGFTHLIDAILFWEPVYRLSGLVKFITSLVSIGTAVVLGLVMPRAMQYKSPETLQKEVDTRKRIQNQLELFVKNCPGAIAMLDTEMRYILVNQNWNIAYNLGSESVVGKSHYDAFPNTLDSQRAMHNRVLGGETIEREFEQFDSGDSTVYVRYRLHPWYHPDGLIGGLIIFNEIITDEVLIKQQLKEREELLENRTKELKSALAELESFSYSVSHDLRAPLRAIHGFSEALMADNMEQLDEQGVKYLSRISANSIRMGKLIDELLQFSRLDRKKKVFQQVELNKLIEGIIKDYFEVNKSYIELKKIPSVYCDSELIYQVFVNIISNAVKYSSKEASPKVIIDSKELEDEVIVTVSDNGVGFNMAYADKLFKVFQRLHGDSEFEGTGVGLALANKIMKAHGGEIWAESEEGKGATFYIKFLKKHGTHA